MKYYKLFFLLSFIEGAAVMACELIGSKMIAPFFGGSLYVWAAVLGVTLFALMSGYYLGGFLSVKYPKKNLVYWILLFAGVFLMLMPFTSVWIMKHTIDFSVQMGSTLSLLVFMFPPLIFMGMTSPVLISLINESVETTGKSAGSIYAISTLGGIFATFFVGFYFLPEFGVKWPSYLFGISLMIIPFVLLLKNKAWLAGLFIIPIFFSAKAHSVAPIYKNKGVELVYESEGIFGQLRVFDMPFLTFSRGWKKARVLMVNNTGQTMMDLDDPEYDVWDWSYYFPTAASVYPKGSDVLLLGLGGGTLVQQFKRLGFNLDVVELDKRIRDVAVNYFFIDPSTNIMIDDARHYINVNKKKYDIVTLDLFLNETPPSHVLTKESFMKIGDFLKEDGMIMMNFYGYISGDIGRASRSVYRTFLEAGFTVKLLVTPGSEGQRNLIFLASKKEKSFENVNYSEPDLPVITDLSKSFLDTDLISFDDGIILTDESPRLEKLYLPAALDWRRTSIDHNLKKIIDKKIDLLN